MKLRSSSSFVLREVLLREPVRVGDEPVVGGCVSREFRFSLRSSCSTCCTNPRISTMVIEKRRGTYSRSAQIRVRADATIASRATVTPARDGEMTTEDVVTHRHGVEAGERVESVRPGVLLVCGCGQMDGVG